MGEVFISYSWDSEDHKLNVLSFTNHLRENGFIADVDRNLSQQESAINFVVMMHKGMLYPKVIVILSEGYKIKAESFSGGVGDEYSILLNDIKSHPKKYILASFDGRSDEIVPIGLKGRDIVDLSTPGGEERLFRKLLEVDEFELSAVADEKPKIAQKKIAKYESPKIENEGCPIDIVSLDVKNGNASLFGGLYKFIDLQMTVVFKNKSPQVVDNFAYEFRINKLLDPEYYLKSVEGDDIVYSENIEKIFPNQPKRSRVFEFKLTSHIVSNVIGTNIIVNVFTGAGSITKEYAIADLIKLQHGYGDLVPINKDLFLN